MTGRNPYVFIVGCPRSGTSMLERMVNAHPQIAIIHETHWIARFFRKRTGLTRQGIVTPKLVRRLSEYHRFRYLRVDRQDLLDLVAISEPMTYGAFVSRIFDMYGKHEGKPLVGDKTTGDYIRHIPLLHSLWPEARFIHLIRDGRDVCLSMLNWPKADRAAGRWDIWAADPVATTALWWAWHVRSGIEGGRSIEGPGCHEVRFESLVERPREEARALCAFLDVPFQDAMLAYHEGRTRTDPGLSANQAWLPPTPGLRDWRIQMQRRDIEMFEALAGDLLSALGYQREFDVISAAVSADAQQFRSWFEANVASPPASADTGSSR